MMATKAFTGNETFLLWGVGRWGRLLVEFFPELPVQAWIDSDVDKQNTKVAGYEVLSYEDAKKSYPDAIIVITMIRVNALRRFLSGLGFTERHDFFSIHDFIPQYAFQVYHQRCLYSLHFAPNNTCTLKCDGCLTYVPYAEQKRIRPLEDLKRDADLVFQNIDRVMLVCGSSGEPFMHPQIVDFWEHVSSCYANQYHAWNVITNGTIVPSDDALTRIKECRKLYFSLSDYSDRLPRQGDSRKRLIEKLEAHGIKYFLNASSNEEYWDHCGDPRAINDASTKLLEERYAACSKSPSGVLDGKFFSCMQEGWAHMSLNTPLYAEDYLELADENDKEKLLNIIMRTPPKGYLEFCRHCNGRIS